MDKELLKNIHNRTHFYENVESLATHLDKFCREGETTVFHEMLSLDFHLDVYYINRKEDNFNMLITSGMSLLKMQVPEDLEDKEDYSFAELMLLIPKKLDFEEIHTGEEKNGWIISMLKETARFPHHYDTWLSFGHTLQQTADLQPYHPDTEFVGCAILPSVTFDEEFTEFYSADKKINLYSLFPLYKDELEYKIKNGYSKFMDVLAEANAAEIFNPKRENLVTNKRL